MNCDESFSELTLAHRLWEAVGGSEGSNGSKIRQSRLQKGLQEPSVDEDGAKIEQDVLQQCPKRGWKSLWGGQNCSKSANRGAKSALGAIS